MATKVSSIVTGGVTVSAAALAPLVQWALDGFPAGHYPSDAPLLIAAGLITIGHAVYNRLTSSTSQTNQEPKQ